MIGKQTKRYYWMEKGINKQTNEAINGKLFYEKWGEVTSTHIKVYCVRVKNPLDIARYANKDHTFAQRYPGNPYVKEGAKQAAKLKHDELPISLTSKKQGSQKGKVSLGYPTDIDAPKKAVDKKQGKLTCYVDGSFAPDKKRYGYGVVAICHQEKSLEVLSGEGIDKDGVEAANAGGEFLAVMKSLEYASKRGHRKVEILYDFKGIASSLEFGKTFTSAYINKYRAWMSKFSLLNQDMEITLTELQGYTGNSYHNLAHNLSRIPIGANGASKQVPPFCPQKS